MCIYWILSSRKKYKYYHPQTKKLYVSADVVFCCTKLKIFSTVSSGGAYIRRQEYRVLYLTTFYTYLTTTTRKPIETTREPAHSRNYTWPQIHHMHTRRKNLKPKQVQESNMNYEAEIRFENPTQSDNDILIVIYKGIRTCTKYPLHSISNTVYETLSCEK